MEKIMDQLIEEIKKQPYYLNFKESEKQLDYEKDLIQRYREVLDEYEQMKKYEDYIDTSNVKEKLKSIKLEMNASSYIKNYYSNLHSLNDQLDEITKLPKGVAVIYQNDWLEPVLCKIEKFKGEERPYKKTSTIFFASSDEQKKTLIQSLLRKNVGEQLDMTVGELTNMLIGMDIPTNLKMKAIKVFRINGTCSLNDISPIIYDLVCNYLTEKEAENVDSIEEWRNVFIYAQDSLLADFDTSNQNRAIECVLREQIERYDKPAEYLNAWNEFLKKEVM